MAFFSDFWNVRVVEKILMGGFLLGLAVGEVLFAEILVIPTSVSKAAGEPCIFWCVTTVCDCQPDQQYRRVASQEDSQRAIRELSEQPLLGRPVFIREVFTSYGLDSNRLTMVRTEKMKRASVPPLLFLEKLEWRWLARFPCGPTPTPSIPQLL
jgi:hypothetical protein